MQYGALISIRFCNLDKILFTLKASCPFLVSAQYSHEKIKKKTPCGNVTNMSTSQGIAAETASVTTEGNLFRV